jgi:biopolymer transport protein TolQ
MMFQIGGALPSSSLELITSSSPETMVVLVIIAIFSVISWFIIGYKWWQFRRLHRQADRFFAELERAPGLQAAYRAVMKQPPSPYTRLFREGMTFYSELKTVAAGAPAPDDASDPGHRLLTPTQLDAFKGVLGKEVAAERETLGHYVPWLATIGTVGPLLGLLGTVLGVMDAFLGIAAGGSGNIAAVAPGVAEALITTVGGLAAAIPAVIAYNIYVNRIRLFTNELEGFGNELIGSMAREGMI